MATKDYEFHPLASVLPMLGTADANELASDIQANGLREDIVLFEGKILDGRNRYRACKSVNVEPRFRDFNGAEGHAIDYIVSKNIKRRHLTASQKALMVAKYAVLPRGNPSMKSSKTPAKPKSVQSTELGKPADKVATDIGVSTSTVEQAKRVLRDAPKETVAKVERGEKSVASAVKELREAKQEQTPALDKTGYPVPDAILADWKRAEGFAETLRKITQVKSVVSEALDHSDPIFAEVTNTTLSTLTNAYNDLKRVLPYAVCTTCQGRAPKKCSTCGSRGFLSKFYYQTCIPEEIRKLRAKAVGK